MRIIVFAEDWGAHPSSTQHLFKQLAKTNQVSWFNSIGMRTPSLSFRDIKRVWQKFTMLFKSKPTSNNAEAPVTVLNPFILPWHHLAWVRKFNRWSVGRAMTLNEEPVVFWLSVPTAEYLIPERSEDTIIYYCGDDFSALAGVDPELVAPFEQKLERRADLIFTASQILAEKFTPHKTHVLTHGVDLALFNKSTTPATALTKERPVIGFYGSIDAWLDQVLIAKVARHFSHCDIMLVGNVKVDVSALKVCPNIKFVPAVAHQELASFSQHWQVSMLPFLRNEQIKACNPLKLKEYLAVGTPVVATRFPVASEFEEIVMVADNHSQFIHRVALALALENSLRDGWKQASKEWVGQEDWQHKIRSVITTLEKLDIAI